MQLIGYGELDSAIDYLFPYFVIGFIFLLIDLWKSKKDSDTKIWWSVALVALSFILLPVYWFTELHKQDGFRPN